MEDEANGKTIALRNEFTSLELEVDETANGPRLLIRNYEEGEVVYLGLLEIESLTRMKHEDWVDLVKPD